MDEAQKEFVSRRERKKRSGNNKRLWFSVKVFVGIVFCLGVFVFGLYLGLRSSPMWATDSGYIGDAMPKQQVSGNRAGIDDTRTDETVAKTQSEAVQPTAAQNYEQSLQPVTAQNRLEHNVAITLNELRWPVYGQIIRSPGWYFSETLGEWRYFAGVDISAKPQEEVHAALPGVIKNIFKDAILGDVIVIGHGPNLETRYAWVSPLDVKPGDKVNKDQPIGRARDSRIYFQILQNGNIIDPGEYLKTPGN